MHKVVHRPATRRTELRDKITPLQRDQPGHFDHHIGHRIAVHIRLDQRQAQPGVQYGLQLPGHAAKPGGADTGEIIAARAPRIEPQRLRPDRSDQCR